MATADNKMSLEEMQEHYDHTMEIIYDNLQKILETRPSNPVSTFANMILEAAGLDKNGDPLPEGQAPTRKNKHDSDEDSQKKKKSKKHKDSDDEAKEKKK